MGCDGGAPLATTHHAVSPSAHSPVFLSLLTGKTLAFLLPLCMRVRALRQAADEAAEEGEGEEGEEREAELEAEAEGLKAVVVR